MKKVFKHTIKVPAEAIDANGHANNVYYIQWMQDAAILHSEEAKCTQLTESLGATWVIRTHKRVPGTVKGCQALGRPSSRCFSSRICILLTKREMRSPTNRGDAHFLP